MEKVRNYIYYILIGILSFITLVFLPMVGSQVGLEWKVPDTYAGWTVWLISKLSVSCINVLMFYCFNNQGKLNVRNDERFKKANEILEKHDKKHRSKKPLSPVKWTAKQYGFKGASIFISTLLSTVAFTQAILSFDYMSMVTYLFVIIMGLIFGIIQMQTAQIYWTEEYYQYALTIKEEEDNEQEIINTEINEEKEKDLNDNN